MFSTINTAPLGMSPESTNFKKSDKADSLEKFFPLNPDTPSSEKVWRNSKLNCLANDSAAPVWRAVESPVFCFVDENL